LLVKLYSVDRCNKTWATADSWFSTGNGSSSKHHKLHLKMWAGWGARCGGEPSQSAKSRGPLVRIMGRTP